VGDDAELRGTTTLDGFRVLWVGIKREPIVFTVATAGAVLFGVLTVADAWVLGWATQHVLIPAFETGEIGTDMLLWVVALFLGVAILRAVGIVGDTVQHIHSFRDIGAICLPRT
jgi:ABC-type multidrug transport system fused ATPase/permease subunit